MTHHSIVTYADNRILMTFTSIQQYQKTPEYVDHVKTLGENALACNNPMNF